MKKILESIKENRDNKQIEYGPIIAFIGVVLIIAINLLAPYIVELVKDIQVNF